MQATASPPPNPQRSSKRRALYALLGALLVLAGPALACGSFQPRPTPTPTTAAGAPLQPLATEPPVVLELPTPTPVLEPTPTFTPTPIPGTALAVGQPARVAAPGGLNIRETPGTSGPIITRLGFGQLVTVLEGPVSADGFIWWKVDDGQGNVGWAAQGDGVDEWLTPNIGEPQPVNRPPRVGDRVRVTMDPGLQLTIRALPGINSPVVTRVNPGTEFTVIGGPQPADGYMWYQIRSDDGQIEGWAADGTEDTRWLSPLE